jgi:hypothetical protein
MPGDQLDMFAQLGVRTELKTARDTSKHPENAVERRDGLTYLKGLVEDREPLIFLVGANPNGRFIRTHSRNDLGRYWLNGIGCAVMYSPAREILRAGGYYHHSNHTYADELGNTGQKRTADVWRLDKLARVRIDRDNSE